MYIYIYIYISRYIYSLSKYFNNIINVDLKKSMNENHVCLCLPKTLTMTAVVGLENPLK